MELHQEVASILNQLGFQVNGKELDPHNVVTMFAAVRSAWSRLRIPAGEGAAVGLGTGDPIPVSPAIVGAPVDPAARTHAGVILEMAYRGAVTKSYARRRIQEILGTPAPEPDFDGRPSPNLDPDAWADGGRPDVPLDDPDPEPVSSPPAPWPEPAESPSEPSTPAGTRDPGVSPAHGSAGPVSHPPPLGPEPDLRERYCGSCPENPHNPDAVPGPCCLDPVVQDLERLADEEFAALRGRYPDPLLDPALWDAAVARGDDPDADQWPDPYDASWSSWRPAEPSPWLLKRRAQTRDGVAVPGLYPGGHDAGRVITIPLPEPDWLDPSTPLPVTWLAHAGIPEHAAVGRPTVAGAIVEYDATLARTRFVSMPADPEPVDPTTPESAWSYPVPEGE